ncbi:hypothetical protein BDV11DRAFT_107127 [Aspergillus similis]
MGALSDTKYIKQAKWRPLCTACTATMNRNRFNGVETGERATLRAGLGRRAQGITETPPTHHRSLSRPSNVYITSSPFGGCICLVMCNVPESQLAGWRSMSSLQAVH